MTEVQGVDIDVIPGEVDVIPSGVEGLYKSSLWCCVELFFKI